MAGQSGYSGGYNPVKRKAKSLGGKPVTKAAKDRPKKATKGTGVVGARAGAKPIKDPGKKSIKQGAGGDATGRERSSKLRSGMRRPRDWKEQLQRYHGETI